jgi:hypothetical protein
MDFEYLSQEFYSATGFLFTVCHEEEIRSACAHNYILKASIQERLTSGGGQLDSVR